MICSFAAPVTGVRVEPLNNTAVNVSWTPVTIQETDHIFTIHYTVVSCIVTGVHETLTAVLFSGSTLTPVTGAANEQIMKTMQKKTV